MDQSLSDSSLCGLGTLPLITRFAWHGKKRVKTSREDSKMSRNPLSHGIRKFLGTFILGRVGRLKDSREPNQNPTSPFLQNLEESLENVIKEILDQEEWLWIMKCRINWMTEGERNTAFFHRSVIIKRCANRILTLRNEVGESLTNPQEIRDHIRTAFVNLYTSDHIVSLQDPIIHSGSMNIAYYPSGEEIRLALFSMKPLKSPGPDGFHPIFFQKKWNIVSMKICHKIQEWFTRGKIPEHLGQALICLIPKQSSPETVKHLRPISLCNTIYKLVTKIIVNRLKPFIPQCISPNQNSFMKGRGPDVNIVVASEIIHPLQKKKGKWGWFALKIDLEKAYDRMEWSFV